MKHNVYFDGKVQSLGVNTAEGYATVGVISPGAYTFSTATPERMVIITGVLNVKLPGEEWKRFGVTEEVKIKEQVSFDVRADYDVAYICYYN